MSFLYFLKQPPRLSINFAPQKRNGKLFCVFSVCSEAKSTWLITSELANQNARKALFTCVIYTNENIRAKISSMQITSVVRY